MSAFQSPEMNLVSAKDIATVLSTVTVVPMSHHNIQWQEPGLPTARFWVSGSVIQEKQVSTPLPKDPAPAGKG